MYALAVELHEPLNTLKPVGEDLWVVDGPVVRMAFPGGSMPFPTRMVVVRLSNGDLFVWSPTEFDDGLRAQLDALGPIRHLVTGLDSEELILLLLWRGRHPADCFYRAASSVFEAFLPKRVIR